MPLLVSLLALAACVGEPASQRRATTAAPASVAQEPVVMALVSEDDISPRPTKILSHVAAERLRQNTGLTLQWIGWDERGQLKVYERREEIWIEGSQGDPVHDDAYLYVNGRVAEIGVDYFILDGEITIVGTPDSDRVYKGEKEGWRFAVTKGRKYWRLREFEWCDDLTDYVDIYF